jgi:PAS domain S-box-containing protein
LPPEAEHFKAYPQWALLICLLLFAGGILFSHLYTSQVRIWVNEKQRLSAQAEAMRKNIEYQLESVRNVLLDIHENLAPRLLISEPFESIHEISHQSLVSKLNIMPGVRTLGVVDHNGNMVASSRKQIVGRDFSDRDYFRVPKADREAGRLYVGPPFNVRPGNAWTVSLSLAVLGPDGQFKGVVFAALDQSFFSALLSSMNYTPDMWTAIAHGNGRQFMMTPERAGMNGLDLSGPDSLFSRHMSSGETESLIVGKVLSTDDERIMAVVTIDAPELKLDWPLVLGTSRNVRAVFSLWNRDLRLAVIFYALAVLLSVVLLLLYQRHERAQKALKSALDASLLAERRRLAGILEGTNVGTWEWHVQSGHVVFNERWANIVGYSLDELQPISIETWTKLTHPDDLARSDQLLQQHFAGELDYYECEARMRHKSGTWVWVLDRGRVMQRGTDGTPLVMMGTHTDVTEKKTAELRLKASADSLERYNQELEQFASVVSHDLRQPIGMVNSYLELLRIRYGAKLDAGADNMIAAAERGARRLDTMLQGLLEYARTGLNEQPRNIVNIADVMSDVRDLLSTEIKQARVKLVCSPTVGTVGITACRDDLLRLFMNLISNSIKYRQSDVDPVIELSAKPHGTGWCFTLVDNGIGFDPSQSARLFKMYQRLHQTAEYPGSGVGLAICKKIVERYQGKIEIESAGPGSGASVRFVLYSDIR